MTQISIPVNVLDEKCATCQCIQLTKNEYYADMDRICVEYSCANLRLCQFIRNRIVRNEEREAKNNEKGEMNDE